MKKILIILCLLCLLTVLVFGHFLLKTNSVPDNKTIVSPVPGFLTILNNKEVSTINLWLPALKQFFADTKTVPQISARSALILDTESSKVLYQKNPTQKLPMASLTKIMTAIIVLENPKSDDKYQVSANDLVGEDSMGLETGEILSQKELLYGLMLKSGNDAAETFASNFKGGRSAFIQAMNNKAKALGLTDTNFTNPTGLEGDGNQYITAYDLLVITKYALDKFPLFAEVVSTFDYNIDASSTHKVYYLENETNLLTSYPGVKGVKTGYTPEAGLCLVTYLDYGGHKILGVILDSENRRDDMKQLLDYSLKSLKINPPRHG